MNIAKYVHIQHLIDASPEYAHFVSVTQPGNGYHMCFLVISLEYPVHIYLGLTGVWRFKQLEM